jgi:hypothetical protein
MSKGSTRITENRFDSSSEGALGAVFHPPLLHDACINPRACHMEGTFDQDISTRGSWEDICTGWCQLCYTENYTLVL